jgi:uncharacterized protein (TIGR02145 family)
MKNLPGTLGVILIIFIIPSCTKDNLPVLTTAEVLTITPVSAIGGGTIIDDGGLTNLSYGVCWSTSINPTIASSKTIDGTVKGTYTSIITGLVANTTYYVRAYAKNKAGTAYGEQYQFITPTDLTGQTGTVTDIEGNEYSTIGIGNQIWIKENLKSTRFNDDTAIPLITSNIQWGNSTSPGYCWYNNNEADNKVTYGTLYNWYTINTGKLCPEGWHVPSDVEWHTLICYLGISRGRHNFIESASAGGKMKESGTMHWKSPNTGATNESGFTALPAGERGTDGTFYEINIDGFWWSSSEESSGTVLYRYVNFENSEVYRGPGYKQAGLSVRCIKNN